MSDSNNTAPGSPTDAWNIHILYHWIKGYIYALACDKSKFIMEIKKAKKKSNIHSYTNFREGGTHIHKKVGFWIGPNFSMRSFVSA